MTSLTALLTVNRGCSLTVLLTIASPRSPSRPVPWFYRHAEAGEWPLADGRAQAGEGPVGCSVSAV